MSTATLSKLPLYYCQLEKGLMNEQGMIPGVVVIQVGPAKGHYALYRDGKLAPPNYSDEGQYKDFIPQWIDATTLQQVCDAMAARKQTKAKLEHDSGVPGTFGSYVNPRVDGDKVRADLQMMTTSEHKDFVTEIFKDFSQDFGNSIDSSVAFELGEKNNKKVALLRLKVLNSIDLVDYPAATNALFSENPQPDKPMPLTNEEKIQLTTDISATVLGGMQTALTEGLKPITSRLQKLEEKEETDEDKKKREAKEKGETDDGKMEALVAKATLAAVNEVYTKLGKGPITPGSERATTHADPFEEKVQLAIGAGAKSRGTAIAMAARANPALYEMYMKKNG